MVNRLSPIEYQPATFTFNAIFDVKSDRIGKYEIPVEVMARGIYAHKSILILNVVG
jgi:hypothetical protein